MKRLFKKIKENHFSFVSYSIECKFIYGLCLVSFVNETCTHFCGNENCRNENVIKIERRMKMVKQKPQSPFVIDKDQSRFNGKLQHKHFRIKHFRRSFY